STLEVVEQLAAACHHCQQPATGGMILLVGAEVLREVVDAVSQTNNLHVRAASVLLVDLEGRNVCRCDLAHVWFQIRQPGGEVHLWFVEEGAKHRKQSWQATFNFCDLICALRRMASRHPPPSVSPPHPPLPTPWR